ncbi:MAG: class II aldolase/adducin family protein [Treponema sp.]|jgi:L-fuculose-phosphate aldolase|nr:class II aldolase/adducin family protein [Treponema sp.]
MDRNAARSEVLKASAELVERGLVARTWGNISCRLDDKCFVITPSGIGYDRLSPGMIVVVDIDTLRYEGGVKPSSEKGIHAAAYKSNRKTNFVIHTHQTYATCISVAGFANLKPAPGEEAELGGEIMLAGYGLPGTKKLRKNVAKGLHKNSSAILMEKHGALITGEDREAAFKRAVLLEDICHRAMSSLNFSDGSPDGISCLVSGDQLLYTANGDQKKYALNGGDLPFPLRIHAALLSSNPAAKIVVHRTTETCAAVLGMKKLPAILDDFAQMVGNDAKCVLSDSVSGIVKALKKRNGALVKELGAVCYAGDESDAAALLTLMEKNALAFLHASRYGKVPVLPLPDRKLMRIVYLKKYSKRQFISEV